MKTFIVVVMMLLPFAVKAQETAVAENRILLSFKKEVQHAEPGATTKFGVPAVDALNEAYGCVQAHAIKRSTGGYGGVYVLSFTNSANTDVVREAYSRTGLFSSVSPDHTGAVGGFIPNDSLFAKQWALHNDGSFDGGKAKAGADIDMQAAWDVEDGDTSVIMAVIDTGVKPGHQDFAGRLWRNKNDIPGNGIDDDNNSYTDDTLGWNFVVGVPDMTDDNGHGTHVAGIIGANVNNTTAYAGVDQHCQLMICKAINSQGLYNYAWLLEAIYYAVDNGADIINISAGGSMTIPELVDVVDYAYDHGVLIVAGMGNSASSSKLYPAAYSKVLSVGATNALDTTWKYSNYGKHLCVVAPGEQIYGLSYQNDTAVTIAYSGTSQATPHVSGIASLLLAQDKTRTPAQLKELIQNNSEDLVGSSRDLPGWDEHYGYGRVNAWRALTNAALEITPVNNEDGVVVFPNPAKDVVYIVTGMTNDVQLSISNSLGQVLYTSTVKGRQAVKLDGFVPGYYIVNMNDGKAVKAVKLVVE